MTSPVVNIESQGNDLYLVVTGTAVDFKMKLDPKTVFGLARSLSNFSAQDNVTSSKLDPIVLQAPSYTFNQLSDRLHMTFTHEGKPRVALQLTRQHALQFVQDMLSFLERGLASEPQSKLEIEAKNRQSRELAPSANPSQDAMETTTGNRSKRASTRSSRRTEKDAEADSQRAPRQRGIARQARSRSRRR